MPREDGGEQKTIGREPMALESRGPLENHVHITNIFLQLSEGTEIGDLTVCSWRLEWKKCGEATSTEVSFSEIIGITWIKDRWYQLCIRIRDGSIYNFLGIPEQDAGFLSFLFQDSLKIKSIEKQTPIMGKNCIEVALNDEIMTFMLGSEQSCKITLMDRRVYLKGKHEASLIILENAALMRDVRKFRRVKYEDDFLLNMTFHMPHCDNRLLRYPSSQFFHDELMLMADFRTSRDEAIALFRLVSVGTGEVGACATVELHHLSLRISGLYWRSDKRIESPNDMQIEYTSISQIFLIPESVPGDACVVLQVDTSVKSLKTANTYTTFVFKGKDAVHVPLQMTEEFRVAEYGGRLKASYEGPMHEVFASILAGLADKEVSRPGSFRNSVSGHAISAKCLGVRVLLYLLEKCFAYGSHFNPIIPYNKIESVKFREQGEEEILCSDMSEEFEDGKQFFKMLIAMKTGEKHMFEMIRIEEYQNLFEFLKKKQLEVMGIEPIELQITKGLTSSSQPKEKALPGLANVVEQSTCMTDLHNFWRRLERIYSYWKGCDDGMWGICDVLTVAVPQVPDTKSSAFSIWLLGHEVPGMVMIFTEKNIYFLCPQDQTNVLGAVKDSVGRVVNTEMTIRVMVENHHGAALMDEVLDAIQFQCSHKSLVGHNAAELPKVGYFGSWIEKLKSKFELCDITDALSELFSVKDGVELGNIRAASSLASSVIEHFVVPEIVHMFGIKVAPHSELIDDMVEFIYDEAEYMGLRKETVGICGGQLVFQSGCGFRLDDLNLLMDNWDLECPKTGVIISSIGLRCDGYWSNLSRTFLIHPHVKQLQALRVLFNAQKAAISALRPGNKASAAYQAAVTVVKEEAPEFVPHLTNSAGSGIGLEFCESGWSLDASNERVLEVGMVFNVSLGFENLQAETGNPLTERFSMLIADTAVINEVSTGALTDFAPCLIGADDECLKVIKRHDYEAENPRFRRHYVASEDVWDDAVNFKNNCGDVLRSIQVDEKMEAVVLPLFESVVPFHISCIRRIVGSGGERDGHYYLSVVFNTDDDKKLELGSKAPSYLQEIMYYFKGPRGVREIGRGIKALQLKYALRVARARRAKEAAAAGNIAQQQDSDKVRGNPCKMRRPAWSNSL